MHKIKYILRTTNTLCQLTHLFAANSAMPVLYHEHMLHIYSTCYIFHIYVIYSTHVIYFNTLYIYSKEYLYVRFFKTRFSKMNYFLNYIVSE